MKNLIWLVPFGAIVLSIPIIAVLTMGSAGLILAVPAVLVSSVLGAGCLEKAVGAGFFPWKWKFKGKSNGQKVENQAARQPARNAKR